MHTLPYQFARNYCPNHSETTSTWANIQQRNYLANVNYKLVNEINEAETEKHFYKTKLTHQFRNHHDQLEQSFRIINERNEKIIKLEEELDLFKKNLRAAADDYLSLQRNAEDQKEYYQAELQNTKATCQQKIKRIEEENQKRLELKLKKRVQQVENECSDRIKMYTQQITLLTENSKQLSHQLTMLQQDYRQILLKNDTIIQESIHRQLRKRDFEAQNNYLSDLAHYQTIKKENSQLKETITSCNNKISSLQNENRKLVSKAQVQSQKIKDLQEAFQDFKQSNKIELFEKYKQVCQVQTNTQKQFVPIVMPIDMNLMSEVVSLKQFLIQKIVFRFLEFFQKSTGPQAKKTSKSLIVFKNCLQQLKIRNPQIKILLFLHTNLEKIIKIYCPSLNNYSREFLTIKDEFIRKTLIQCETITNASQKLFRMLDLFFRIKSPLNHLHSQITNGQLKLVQIKLLTCLKKNFT